MRELTSISKKDFFIEIPIIDQLKALFNPLTRKCQKTGLRK